MNKLFIDTSAGELSLAIQKDDSKPVITSFDILNKIAEEVVPLIKLESEKAGLKFDSYDQIYVTTGPGSYTGERISLTLAKTYAFIKSSCQIFLISTLKLMSLAEKEHIGLALLDARNNAYFGGAYLKGKPILKDKRYEGEEINKFLLAQTSEVSICVMKGSYKLISERFKEYKVCQVNLPQLMVDSQKFFALSNNPLDIKPNYLKDA